MASNDSQIRRVTRSRAEARASYNRMSAWYDRLAATSERELIDTGLRRLRVREGERVLEIGSGTGYALPALGRAAGGMGTVVAVDISEGMLEIARRRVIRAGLASTIALRQGDAARLPFKTGSMNAVWSSFTLELFDTPEIPIVLNECRRVLCAGGRLGIAAMSKKGGAGLMLRLYEWLHDRLPRYVDCRPVYVEDAVRRAGFHFVESTLACTWGLPVEIVLARS
jgi:demethylmenaquinone methyltransferase/2-methoxy-6-polyprenyl-1,4-benzoquinol methylase